MESLGPAVADPDTPRGMAQGSPRATNLAAGIALVTLAGVWSWWAAQEGAYFGAVFYPGVVVLCAGFLLVTSRAAWPGGLKAPASARLAVGALLALGAWSALSALWSPSPDIAVADAQRIFGYALAFGFGLWLSVLAGKRIHLAMVPLALAGLFAGGVVLVALLSGDDYAQYIEDGTLQFPLGYRNANAAFFLIALWPAVHLAAHRALDWRLRALALAAATLCIELAVLSQSRGSTVAAVIALIVLLATSPERARMLGWVLLAAAPALMVIPAVTDLYATADVVSYEGTSELRVAGRAALRGALIALACGAVAALLGRRLRPQPRIAERANRAVAIGAVGFTLVGLGAFAAVTGDPLGWMGDRADEFLTQGTPESNGASRFRVNAGSERDELWRIALREAGDAPLLGTGGGGYAYAYQRERSAGSPESVKDAHSVELEVLSELGLPGLALLLVALTAAVGGVWRGRRAGPEAAAVSACALTAGTYWLAHSSIDWFWAYPAITAPVLALLGAACAAGAAVPSAARRTWWRRIAAVAAILLALSAVPSFLSERYLNAAYDGWRADPDRAADDLERSRALNPLSVEPLVAEGAIARASGDRNASISAFEEAADERPEEFAAHYFLAVLLIDSDLARARAAADRAQELSPHNVQVKQIEERLRRAETRRRVR